MRTSTIYYRVPVHCEGSYYLLHRYQWDTTTFDLDNESSAQRCAEECAEDYHSHHDGWEATWPLVFSLHLEDEGEEICRFEVDRESVPQFSASRRDSPTTTEEKEDDDDD